MSAGFYLLGKQIELDNLYRLMDGWMDIWMDRWMHGWNDGWRDGWMD